MLLDNSDREWEKFGATDPYFGVCTNERYHKSRLDEEALSDFFKSGENRVNAILATIRRHLDPTFTPTKALDFGCGVGRLLIPLAKIARHVVGMDISDAMLNEARKNCDLRTIKNVTFIKSDDNLSLLSGKYDFVLSYIVLQHIPRRRGERILARLIDCLDEGGVGVIHFVYYKSRKYPKIVPWIKNHLYFTHFVSNLFRRRPPFAPRMQMNRYDLTILFCLLQSKGIHNSYFQFTNDHGALGVVLFFQVKAEGQ